MDASGTQPREAFYGGAAGGGKSEAILMAAAMYVENPGYSALILRKNLPDLRQPGALIPRSHEWWDGTEAIWNSQQKTWTFPSGAVIIFGFLEYDKDLDNYMGSEYQFIGYDEMTQFPRHHYTRLGTRLRKRKDLNVPLRVRGASNPGGIGHEWVKMHFMSDEATEKGRVFVASRLEDNPSIDADEYRQTFEDVDPLTRARWLDGDWEVMGGGANFKREWFGAPTMNVPIRPDRVIRFWDTAATAPPPGKEHKADWTVGTKMLFLDEEAWVEDVIRFQGTPFQVERAVLQAAIMDGHDVEIYMEQEPGASGVHMIEHYRMLLDGYAFDGVHSGSNKPVRAKKFSAACESRRVHMVQGNWNAKWLDELEVFPEGLNDDQVDSAAGAYNQGTSGQIVRAARYDVQELFSWQ